jgi:DNA invertase Pin-like site-specific DNA recombinase
MAEQRNRKRAREYLRVSADRTGNLESPQRQHEVNERHADSNGWELGEAYAELQAVSASRYSTKTRAAFDRLAADLASGAFGAEILILWESSRGSRKVGEWVQLIEACEGAGVSIYVTSHSKMYDPADDRDRRSLLEDAVDSEWESAKIRRRAKRTTEARAADGLPHGRVPYGYRREYDQVTRRFIRQAPDPVESEVIRELFERIRNGDTMKGIARDFAERGITTRGTAKFPPRPFTPETLRPMALNPAYAGMRTYQPKGAERQRGSLAGAVGGTWPAIVDAEVFADVRKLLSDPSRRTTRPGKGKHELSMIARCGVCGNELTVRYRRENGQRGYDCRGRGCVRVDADQLDAYAAEAICLYLDKPANARRLAPTGNREELGRVRAELATARTDLDDWRARAARREVTAASFAAIEPGIVADIARLEEAARGLEAPPALKGWPGNARQRWADAVTAQRRYVARIVCSPAYLGWLKVDPEPVPGLHARAADRARWDRGVVSG